MSSALWWKIGGISGALAVSFGAFGAHALRDRVSDEKILAAYNTGAHYHLVHSFALLACSYLNKPQSNIAGSLFLSGIVLFSGSLYMLGMSENRKWGAITPIGGLGFIAGWLVLAFAKLKTKSL